LEQSLDIWPTTSVFDFVITIPDYPRHVVGARATSSKL